MKNKVKQSSYAALALLLGTSAILADLPQREDYRNGLTMSQLTQIPDSLTQSQLPTAGINYWVEKQQDNGNAKQVNCNSLISEAAGYANKAYDNYKTHKEGTDFTKDTNGNYVVKNGEVPILYNGALEATISVENGKIVVAYRGTKNDWEQGFSDWLGTNLNGLTGYVGHVYGTTGTVHSGFHQRFMENKNVVLDTVQQLVNKLGKDTEIVVTGHSLGGASASLAAAFLKHNLSHKANLSLVTFNAPRVFNTQAAADVEALIGKDNMLRVWRDKDPVSSLAFGRLGYKHAGHSIKLDAIDTAYVVGSEKYVPNHDPKVNATQANGNVAIFPRAHTGIIDGIKASEAYKVVANSPVGQAASYAYDAASNAASQVYNAASNAYQAVANGVSDAKKAAWGYFGY